MYVYSVYFFTKLNHVSVSVCLCIVCCVMGDGSPLLALSSIQHLSFSLSCTVAPKNAQRNRKEEKKPIKRT